MATKYTESQSCGVPLKYRCSKCGAENAAAIVLNESASKSIPDLITRGRKNEIIRDLKWQANESLTRELNKLYEKDPIDSGMTIRGKCSKCGNVEPWQTSNAAAAVSGIAGTLVAIAILAMGPVLAAIMDTWVPIVAVPILAIVAIVIYGKMPWVRARADAKRAALKEIAPENRPAYMVPLEELLSAVNAKYKESLEEMED